MRNGILNLEQFGVLDAIAHKYNVKAGDWAEASGGPINDIARISELRRMLTLYKEGMDPAAVGRAWTYDKCAALVNGLKKLIGGENVRKELEKLFKKAANRKERLILKILALPEDDEAQVEMYIDTAVYNKKSK